MSKDIPMRKTVIILLVVVGCGGNAYSADKSDVGYYRKTLEVGLSSLIDLRSSNITNALAQLEPYYYSLAVYALDNLWNTEHSLDRAFLKIVLPNLIEYRQEYASNRNSWSKKEILLEKHLVQYKNNKTISVRSDSDYSKTASDSQKTEIRLTQGSFSLLLHVLEQIRDGNSKEAINTLENIIFGHAHFLLTHENLSKQSRQSLLEYIPKLIEYRQKYRNDSSKWSPMEKFLEDDLKGWKDSATP